MKAQRISSNPYRLDKKIEPLVYTIELTPELSNFTFQGKESIALRVRQSFSEITLHTLDLKITKAFLVAANLPEEIPARKIIYNEKWETITLKFGKTIKSDRDLSLVLEFEGILNDKMHGFYRTSYEVNGDKRWGAATQFEATDARRAFPCWDEPDRKAKFNVTLKVPKNLTALSNMPILKETSLKEEGLKKIIYQETPVMSTYLLAFVIADLASIEATDKKGTVIRVWTTPGKKEQGRFALDVALHALPYFAEWFRIPYALPKMDMVALPDFASGAMENWGLVTYRETALLVDPENSSAAARQRVAEVVDHELAHQWFGNLVTMEWWTDLWLNEGFASYMGPKAVDHQFPEWKIWDQYVVMEHLTALRDDSLRNTHPIEIPVQNPHEIREIFDHITYSKGSVVNRMLEHFLGENIFRKGLRRYLKRYAYQNARTKDLWHALEEVSGKPVKKMMAGYTQQGGYPVLIAKEEIKKGKQFLSLEQKRFLFDGGRDPQNLRWDIPLTMTMRGTKKSATAFINKRSAIIPLTGQRNAWIKLNLEQSGFYRVAYSAELLTRLTAAMASNQFSSVIDYLGILDDVLALARAGFVKTSKALEVFKSCRRQTDYNVWAILSGGIVEIENLLEDSADRRKLGDFARGLFGPITRKIGWTESASDSHADILLRSLLISHSGYYGDEEIIEEAKRRFANFVQTGNLPPNLRQPVYSLNARYGGIPELEKLLEIFRGTTLQEEKVRVLRSITRFRQPETIQKVLEFSLSPEVRNQDTYAVLATFGGNMEARAVAWDFIKKHWDILVKRYQGSSVGLLGRIIEGATSHFVSQEIYADVKTFFAKHPIPGTERTMKQSLEVMQSNLKWAERDQQDIKGSF